jgi:hypothetical protein
MVPPPAVRPASQPDPVAPLLHRATLRVDLAAATRLVAALADAARVEWRPGRDTVALLRTGFSDGWLGPPGRSGPEGDRDPLVALLPFALPVLLSRGAWEVPGHWPHGYCPVCGAWPLRADVRGVERERRLRCGRCGADWLASWLRCTYCGESDHHRLGLLAPEGQLESRRVETCDSCRQYLKARSVLGPAGPLEMMLDDLETLELDLVAQDRGFARPAPPGYAVSVELEPC